MSPTPPTLSSSLCLTLYPPPNPFPRLIPYPNRKIELVLKSLSRETRSRTDAGIKGVGRDFSCRTKGFQPSKKELDRLSHGLSKTEFVRLVSSWQADFVGTAGVGFFSKRRGAPAACVTPLHAIVKWLDVSTADSSTYAVFPGILY